jgi:hypothetical protein
VEGGYQLHPTCLLASMNRTLASIHISVSVTIRMYTFTR